MNVPPFKGDPRSVRRPDYTPRSKRPCYDVYAVTPGRPDGHKLVILSHTLTKVLVHVIDGRTQPCTGDAQTCHINHTLYGTRWQGWLFVKRPGRSPVQMVCVTPFTVEVEPWLDTQGFDLRGRVLLLWRQDQRIRSRLHGRITKDDPIKEGLPPCPDMLTQLGTLWGAPDRPKVSLPNPAGMEALRERYGS
jgi:hypothetical protein